MIWTILQVAMFLGLSSGMFILWVSLKKPAKDDPRLSRGLQLLQSKISVLEDLSDRTEMQVKQLTALLEKKSAMIQRKIEEAEAQVRRVDQSREKSMEVAKIFQDRIPHEDIIERQNTVKYVKAARMAHEGQSIEEIMQEVGLPRGEVEFISKVNKDELMFNERLLPSWIEEASSHDAEDFAAEVFAHSSRNEEANVEQAFNTNSVDLSSLEKIGEKFRQAVQNHETQTPKPPVQKLSQAIQAKVQVRDEKVRKVEFPRIDVVKNLS